MRRLIAGLVAGSVLAYLTQPSVEARRNTHPDNAGATYWWRAANGWWWRIWRRQLD
jgi:hypothetical protein